MEILRKIKNNTVGWVLLDQACYSGSNFLLTFAMARFFSISEFGIYSYLLLVVYFLLSIMNAVILQPYQILVSKKNPAKALGFILKLFLVFLGIGLLLCLLLKQLEIFRFVGFNTAWFTANFWSIVIFLGGYAVQDFFRKSILALQQIFTVLCIDLLFLMIFPCLWFFRMPFEGALLTIGLFNLLSSLPGIGYFLKNAALKTQDASYLNYHQQHGRWLLSTSLLQWCSNNFIVFVSGMYLGLEALGALRLVQSFFGVLNVLLQTVENYLLPRTAKIYQNSKTEAQAYLKKLTRQGAWIFGSFFLLVFVFSEALITSFGGEKYRGYGYLIRLMVILYGFIFYGYPVRMAIRMQELNKAFFYGYVLSFGFALASFHFLLKYTALYGAVAGLIACQALMIFYWKQVLKQNQSFI